MFILAVFVIVVVVGLHGGELTVNDVLLALVVLVGGYVVLRLLGVHSIGLYLLLVLVNSTLIVEVFGHDIRLRPWYI